MRKTKSVASLRKNRGDRATRPRPKQRLLRAPGFLQMVDFFRDVLRKSDGVRRRRARNHRAEEFQVMISAFRSDFLHALFGFRKQVAGGGNAQILQIAVERNAHFLREQRGEVCMRVSHPFPDLAQGNRFAVVLIQIVEDRAENTVVAVETVGVVDFPQGQDQQLGQIGAQQFRAFWGMLPRYSRLMRSTSSSTSPLSS